MTNRPGQPEPGATRRQTATLRSWLLGLLVLLVSTVVGAVQPSSMVWAESQRPCADVAVTVAVKPDCSVATDLLDYRVTAGHLHGPPAAVDAQRNAHQTYYVLAGDTPVLVHNTNCSTFGHLSPSGRMDIPNTSGVYKITMSDGRVYVGKASDIHGRIHGAFRPRGAAHDAGYRPGDVRELDWMEMEDVADSDLFEVEAGWIDYEGGIDELINRINSPGARGRP